MIIDFLLRVGPYMLYGAQFGFNLKLRPNERLSKTRFGFYLKQWWDLDSRWWDYVIMSNNRAYASKVAANAEVNVASDETASTAAARTTGNHTGNTTDSTGATVGAQADTVAATIAWTTANTATAASTTVSGITATAFLLIVIVVSIDGSICIT